MKRNIRIFAPVFFAAVILAATSCGRDPIFHIIATETPPVSPLIRGGPTKMVVFNWEFCGCVDCECGVEKDAPCCVIPVLFVASGGLFWYSATEHSRDNEGNIISGINARWRRDIGIPDRPRARGRIIDIATTRNHLYILSMEGTGVNTTLHRLKSGGESWESIGFSGSGSIQTIFADPEGERLFAGVQSRGVNFIWYLADEHYDLRQLPTESRILPNEQPTDNTGLLSGAAFRDGSYFLATRNGVFKVGTGWITDDMARTFMGMIRLPDDTIIVIARIGGFLYEVNDTSLNRIPTDTGGSYMRTGRDATGALALWELSSIDNDGNVFVEERMLIAGVQGSRHTTSFNNGYVEFSLNAATGAIDASQPRRETNNLRSVRGENNQYRTSLARLPINHLFQAPRKVDIDMTFFASTQTSGLWSFRERDRTPQWNAEN